ncbi:alanine racemase [Paenibacillus qinlingensis]|uniref:alanine racemase n=1 Tax=Paenibacillus qinlingensis TaxID=1837343 RepID=UPI0015637BA2|nr:alanine racemase [Paenibacillus qinlingensis]NQX64242.1 alanine racemase [Paenibacillus qinlingensis]
MNKQDLDTPYILIDLEKVEKNIADMQQIANRAGIVLRPHAKTHKIPELAIKQIAAGAIGITVAKIGEAEVMAAAGIQNIFIAYPIVGEQKLNRLRCLAQTVDLTIAVDSLVVAREVSLAFLQEPGISVDVLVEMDCGFGRVGVPEGQPVLDLAKQIAALPGLVFRGIITFAGHSYDAKDVFEIEQIAISEGNAARRTAKLLINNGLRADVVSGGSTPTARFANHMNGITEIRPGTYLFGDLMQVSLGSHRLADCALTVKTTIVSRPAADRAVIDAGTKVFTMDGEDSPIGTGRGYVVGHPGIIVSWFTEEHGILYLPEEARDLAVGQTLEIIPVHCCGVINMFDEAAAIRHEEVEAIWNIQGRGKVR